MSKHDELQEQIDELKIQAAKAQLFAVCVAQEFRSSVEITTLVREMTNNDGRFSDDQIVSFIDQTNIFSASGYC